jgi:ketosteroid isomerase-like protein
MLKKIFLSCLTAAIVLPFPLSVNAATTSQIPATLPLSLAVADKPLSSSDLNSIKKEIDGLINALNKRDSKKYVSHYSRKYQSAESNDPSNYNTIAQNIRPAMEFLKSFGIVIKTQDIKIARLGKDKATAEVIFKVDLSKDSPLNGNAGVNSRKQLPQGLFLTFEKNNGRWLIISDERMIVNSSPTAVNEQQTTASSTNLISKKDQQNFSDFFKRHLDALNRKNLNDYLATLDPNAPQYNQAKQETAQLFREYTLRYTIKSVKVISIGQQEAMVQMVATVKKVSGGGFKDSQMTTTNLLKKTNGKWRIYGTSIDSLTDLQASK